MSCGLEILHPGGIERTDEMARMCKIGKDKKVLDIGSGKGVTACYLAQKPTSKKSNQRIGDNYAQT